jgi:crotonyl-CoA carboxylase/reductase
MLAQVIRSDRLGEPTEAFKVEEIETPTPGNNEVLIGVMAAGINYNNVWAARGLPIDVISLRQRRGEPYDFHIGGSDCAGIVYAVGPNVTSVRVGDRVVTHPGWWTEEGAASVRNGDEMLSPDAAIWGYDTNFGSFAQFALAKEHQVMPKADHLTWEAAAASTLVGATAYRMMFGWAPHVASEGDAVLVWGGSGGVGIMAIQLARHVGAFPVAVVSDSARGEYCMEMGAVGYIDRTEFDHWGVPPHWQDTAGQREWTAGCKAFGKKFRETLGEQKDPALVVEHPGEATVPTSAFVCAPGGMVVICAGTTGFTACVDLRYHWVRQKRLQGSHGTNMEQALAYNGLIQSGHLDPCLGKLYDFEQIGAAHQEMADGVDVFGNRAALVGAPTPGLGRGDS